MVGRPRVPVSSVPDAIPHFQPGRKINGKIIPVGGTAGGIESVTAHKGFKEDGFAFSGAEEHPSQLGQKFNDGSALIAAEISWNCRLPVTP